MGTVVGAGASLALAGTVGLGPEVSAVLSPGVGRTTVLRLLSTAAAAAVFLFASARSRSSMVSCAMLAMSGFFFDSRQPVPPAMNARQSAAGS